MSIAWIFYEALTEYTGNGLFNWSQQKQKVFVLTYANVFEQYQQKNSGVFKTITVVWVDTNNNSSSNNNDTVPVFGENDNNN